MICLLQTVETRNKEKEAGNGPFLKQINSLKRVKTLKALAIMELTKESFEPIMPDFIGVVV